MTTLWTIGYQGYGPDAWLRRVLAEGIELVADVRQLPRSRRPGFSKKALAERLEAVGVRYVSMREFGAPPELRIPLREGSLPFSGFAPAFRRLLEGRAEELDALLRLARTRRTCLLCWEEDPRRCHRSLVAEALGQRARRSRPSDGVEVVHLRRDG
ncbi:MAG: DUF488 domain-containing protein [Coriobacteriia bacterium]|nr:DUF488 domain-containing protein [Coriobacteriia bacterium]